MASTLLAAGFPSLLIERGEVVLSGFVVTTESDGLLRVHWAGTNGANSLPYRRTFLGAYATVLRQAGLTVRYVEGDGGPYLACHGGPRTA